MAGARRRRLPAGQARARATRCSARWRTCASPLRRGRAARGRAARPRSTCWRATSSTSGWPTRPACRPSSSATSTGAACSPTSSARSSSCRAELRRRVRGFVINKFRGDPALLGDAPAELEAPHRRADARRDAVAGRDRDRRRGLAGARRGGELVHRGASTATRSTSRWSGCPRISNFTDLDALGARARRRRSAGSSAARSCGGPRPRRPAGHQVDGRRPGLAARAWLGRRAVERSGTGRRRTVILGICGGYQMLGRAITDADGRRVGDRDGRRGLGPARRRHRVRAPRSGPLRRTGRELGTGCRVDRLRDPPRADDDRGRECRRWLVLDAAGGGVESEGVADAERGVYGTTLHGVFEDDDLPGRASSPRWRRDGAGLASERASRSPRRATPSSTGWPTPARPTSTSTRSCASSARGRPGDPLPHQRRHRAPLPCARSPRACPTGFPPLRAANPHRLAGPPDLDGRVAGRWCACSAAAAPGRSPSTRWRGLCRRAGSRCSRSAARRGSTGSWPAPRASGSRRSLAGLRLPRAGGAGQPRAAAALRGRRAARAAEFGFGPPVVVPSHGVYGRRAAGPGAPDGRPSSSTGPTWWPGTPRFVDELCDAIEAEPGPTLWPCTATRCAADAGDDDAARASTCSRGRGVDAVVTTVLAAGSLMAEADRLGPRGAGHPRRPGRPGHLRHHRARSWAERSAGLSPVDVAMAGRHPRVRRAGRSRCRSPSRRRSTTATTSAAPVSAYRTVPDRVAPGGRPGRRRWPGCARTRAGRAAGRDRAVRLPDQAQPARQRGRASTRPPRCSRSSAPCAAAGYGVTAIPSARRRADGRAGRRPRLRRAAGPRRRPARSAAARAAAYAGVVRDACPRTARAEVEKRWGPAPGTCACRRPGRRARPRLLGPRPRRRGGGRPAAPGLRREPGRRLPLAGPGARPTTTSPSTAGWPRGGAPHAVVHVGKHGTLEWLPGKGVGLSAACFPDAALGDLPLVYPFVVNDPGEGDPGQAPGPRRDRRPPGAAAHPGRHLRRPGPPRGAPRPARPAGRARPVQAARPSAARSGSRWSAAEIHRDLGPGGAGGAAGFDDSAFDDLLIEVDGYLCELKDAQIRGRPARPRARRRPAGRARPGGRHHPAAPGRRRRRCAHAVAARPRPRRGRRAVAAPTSTRSRPSAGAGSRPCQRGRLGRRGRAADGRAGGAGPALGVRAPGAGAGGDDRRDRRGAGRPRRPVRGARAERRAEPRAWPTCCRPAATSTPSTPRPCRRRLAWDVGSAPGRPAARAPPGRGGPATPRRSAWWCGARAPCAPAATTSPRRWRCSGCGRLGRGERAGDRARAHDRRGAGPAPGRRHAAGLGVLPRRLPPRARPPRRRRRAGGRRGGRRRATPSPDRRRRAAGLRAPARRLRVGDPGPARVGQLARRRRPGAVYVAWGGWAYGAGGAAPPAEDAFAPAARRASRWRSRTRTTASTTSSTPTTTSRTTAG